MLSCLHGWALRRAALGETPVKRSNARLKAASPQPALIVMAGLTCR